MLRNFDILKILAILGILAITMISIGDAWGKPLEVVSRGHREMVLEVHKGQLIKLGAPAQTVFVADPAIADVQIKSPTLVYVLGKGPGETTLFAVDRNEQVLASIDLHVSHNVERIRASIQKLHPEMDIAVSSVGDAVVLDGVVDSISTA